MSKPTNSEVVKAVRSSGGFKTISPESLEYFLNKGIFTPSKDFDPVRNEIFNEILDKIITTKIKSMSFDNPLNVFRRGEEGLGNIMEEIFVEGGQEEHYQPINYDQYRKTEPLVSASYTKVNRQSKYRITANENLVSRCFMSETGLSEFMSTIVSRIHVRNEVDSYYWCKKTFAVFYDIILSNNRTSMVLDVKNISTNSSSDDINNYLSSIMSLTRRMTYPSTNYNISGVENTVNRDNLYLITKGEITDLIKVKSLSGSFHPENLNLSTEKIELDNLGDDLENNKIVGILCSKNWLNIIDKYYALKSAINAEGLYTNYFLHVHQLYSASPFEQVVYLRGV